MHYFRNFLLAMVAVLLAACAAATPVVLERVPPRPQLPPDADARDARSYYERGTDILVEYPERAAEAFYWASRLDPTWALPLYAHWVALHLTDHRRLFRYTRGDERIISSPEVQRIDSLAYRAYQLNPSFFRRLQYLWNQTWWRQAVLDEQRGLMPYSTEQLNFILDSLLTTDTTTNTRGWLAYSNRQFSDALSFYARLLSDSTYKKTDVHSWRGHIFHLEGQYDSAQASYHAALEDLRQQDEGELVILYESKAMMEYCLGFAYEAAGDTHGATEAYSRALIADLSFFPAHQRLAGLALASGDTATAILEFELAAESDPTVIMPHLSLGRVLLLSGRPLDAIDALQIAVELEPYYAEPYFVMAIAQEAAGDLTGALLSYYTFATLASATDERRPGVAERIAALSRPGGEG